MGWTFLHKPKGQKVIETMRRELGEEWWTKRVVKASATWEAVHIVARYENDADSKVYVPDADGSIRAILVIHIKNVPNAKDGYTFGYKDMEESMGPVGCECAPSIIAAASPLRDPVGPESDFSSLRSARNYRERSLQVAKDKATKRALKIGTRVTLAKPITFNNGESLDEFVIDRCRLRGRKGLSTVFRSVKTGGLYRVPTHAIGTAVIS